MNARVGATPEGRKELLGFQVGVRESAQSWRELLVDLQARGLAIVEDRYNAGSLIITSQVPIDRWHAP